MGACRIPDGEIAGCEAYKVMFYVLILGNYPLNSTTEKFNRETREIREKIQIQIINHIFRVFRVFRGFKKE